jgi:hypothetical protein
MSFSTSRPCYDSFSNVNSLELIGSVSIESHTGRVDGLFVYFGVRPVVNEMVDYCHVAVSNRSGGRGSRNWRRKDCFGLDNRFRCLGRCKGSDVFDEG